MVKNNKENRQFSTIDLIGLLALFAFVTSLAGAILSETIHDSRPVKARAMAQTFAEQILARRTVDVKKPGTAERMPASVSYEKSLPDTGFIGQDAWGHPYHYRVAFDPSKNETRVFVWSSGPNGRSESDATVDVAIQRLEQERFHFQGDDLGYIKTAFAH